jgi:hypothetical protein
MKKRILIIVALTIIYLLTFSLPCAAFVVLPKDAGINYKTMTVVDASKLKAKGMKKVQNGDTVTVTPSGDGNLLITDKRTGEQIKWIYSKKNQDKSIY